MARWILLGLLLLAPACTTDGDDDMDVFDAVGDDRAGDGNWEDGDALEIRDHATE